MYQEIEPSQELKNVIDGFWTFCSDKPIDEKFKVLPDTCTDLIFDLNQSKGFVSGVMTRFQLCQLTKESDLIGIRFKTENFGSMTEIPLEEIKDLRIDLSDMFPNHTSKLTPLYDLETVSSRKHFLENFISTLFKENLSRQDRMVFSVAENIRVLKGNVDIGELARSNHISIRQLERRFKKHIGLTIKAFSDIIRFTRAKKAISELPDTSLLEIAFDAGFFDHSHMSNTFKRISGANPGSFR